MRIPRVILAGTSSGVGKTSITCGLIYALREAGYTIRPFKVGPDYIDPGHLAAVAGRSAGNLDVWLMGRRRLLASFAEHSDSDVSVIEGVMGYYDGAYGNSDHSSTHHVSMILRAPVILVIDAARASRSVAAIALGFKKFHPNSRIRGIILNRLAGKRHENLCRQALADLRIPILGCIPRDTSLTLDSRHLGLIPAAESHHSKIIKMAQRIAGFLDVKAILDICNKAPDIASPPACRSKKICTSIGVALDSSFNFYYRDNLEALERAGARLKFFSPVSDVKLPRCDGLYIGGGFPEVQAYKLSRNRTMRAAIHKFACSESPIYAECGGLMYLCEYISSGRKRYKMAGVLDGSTSMTPQMRLAYTSATVRRKCMVAPAKSRLHGHEFHYSKMDHIPADSRFAYELQAGQGIRDGQDGMMAYETLASYGHLYFDDKMASCIVQACMESSRR